jgi:hypothetical protein
MILEQAAVQTALFGALAGLIIGGAAGLSRFFLVLAVGIPAAYLLVITATKGATGLHSIVQGVGTSFMSDIPFWGGVVCGIILGFGLGQRLLASPAPPPPPRPRSRDPWGPYY